MKINALIYVAVKLLKTQFYAAYCYRLKDEVRIKVKQSLHVRRTRFIYTNE